MNNDTITILLIENNPMGAYIIHDILFSTFSNYQILWKRNLHDAIQEIDPAPLDLIITNLSLPDSKGFPTFSILKAKRPDTPIIVINEINDPNFRDFIIKNGAKDYIFMEDADEWTLTQSIDHVINHTN